jgi:hypothetical protein
MAAEVKETLIQKVKKSKYFALQVDESTDLANSAQLMTYIRYDTEKAIEEEFLFCKPLSGHTTALEIFNKIDNFITTNEIQWENCVGVCSDGARAMTGKHSGVVTKILQVAPQAKFIHCSIHREALACKSMPTNLRGVLDQSVKVVNFIKSRALNSRMFTILCNEMGSDHSKLLLHSEVRWLSRGKVLSRLFELRSEAQIFLTNSNSDLAAYFLDDVWLTRLAYLADIFSQLNELNSSLQGSNITPFTVVDKVNATIKKLKFKIRDLERENTNSFPSLDEFVAEKTMILQPEFVLDAKQHCSQLILSFQKYFPENLASEIWIRDPFSTQEIVPKSFTVQERDQLIELSCDGSLQIDFKKESLSNFWLKRRIEFTAQL